MPASSVVHLNGRRAQLQTVRWTAVMEHAVDTVWDVDSTSPYFHVCIRYTLVCCGLLGNTLT